jgi:nucleoside-diphosphate-sugar epimerase
MRLAISGAAGFLGQHLVRVARARGHSVVPLVHTRRATFADETTLDEHLAGGGDPRLDAFVHAAAVRHRHGVGLAEYHAANVELVARCVQSLRGSATRFVLVSSVGVYGWPDDLPVSERHPFAPRTTYSETKVLAEQRLRAMAAELGVDFTIVRPCIVYGPGDTNGMLDKMARMIAAGRYAVVGRGRNVLHHVYVDDVVDGILLAASHPAASRGDFILAGPETTTLRELSEHVARACARRLPPVGVPLRAARLAASAIELAARTGLAFAKAEPPINHEKLDVMTRPIAFDIGKARATLGYAPTVGYAEGVARALEGIASGGRP